MLRGPLSRSLSFLNPLKVTFIHFDGRLLLRYYQVFLVRILFLHIGIIGSLVFLEVQVELPIAQKIRCMRTSDDLYVLAQIDRNLKDARRKYVRASTEACNLADVVVSPSPHHFILAHSEVPGQTTKYAAHRRHMLDLSGSVRKLLVPRISCNLSKHVQLAFPVEDQAVILRYLNISYILMVGNRRESFVGGGAQFPNNIGLSLGKNYSR